MDEVSNILIRGMEKPDLIRSGSSVLAHNSCMLMTVLARFFVIGFVSIIVTTKVNA